MASTTATVPTVGVHQRTIDELNRLHDEYLATGVFYVEEDRSDRTAYRRAPRILSAASILRGHFRQVAKELGRPFICGDGWWWGNRRSFYARLTVPRRKALEPVAAPLILGGEQRKRYRPPAAPICFEIGKTVWEFSFCDAGGHRALHGWLALCRTAPEVRRALKLPELPAGVTTEACHDDRRAV